MRPPMSDARICLLHIRHAWPIYLANVDPKANAIVLIPIPTMVMVKITILALILASVMISITRLHPSRSSQ